MRYRIALVTLALLLVGCSTIRSEVVVEGPGIALSEKFVSSGRLNWQVHDPKTGVVIASGSVSNTVPDAGRAHIVSVLRGQSVFAHFHALSTSTSAVQSTDTGCPGELTTQYSTDNVRATGTREQGDTPFVFKTVGSNAIDTAVTIRKFCLMSTSAVGTGVPWTHILLPQDVLVPVGLTVTTTYESTAN